MYKIPTALRRAAVAVGGQRVLAKRLSVSEMAISKWIRTRLPAERVLLVEELTGVSRHELRPDLYPRTPARSRKRFASGKVGARTPRAKKRARS